MSPPSPSTPRFVVSDKEAHANAQSILDPKHDNYDFPLNSMTKGPEFLGYTSDLVTSQLLQLRAGLVAEGYTHRLDTLTLLRFLRARKLDVEAAKQMFIDSEKWRAENNVDELPQSFVYECKEEIFNYYPQFYHKTDKDGRPVYIEQLGKIDLPAMNKIIGGDEEHAGGVMRNNLIVEYEKLSDPRLPACSRKYGHLVETCCTIIDARGVSLFVPASIYNFISTASTLSQNNYPERLGKLYIINTPWGFSTVWTIIKKFIDPVTASKIHIPGSSYVIEELSKQIPIENIPHFLGGKCRCDGPLDCRGSDAGPWREPEYRKPAWWESSSEPAATEPAGASGSKVAAEQENVVPTTTNVLV